MVQMLSIKTFCTGYPEDYFDEGRTGLFLSQQKDGIVLEPQPENRLNTAGIASFYPDEIR